MYIEMEKEEALSIMNQLKHCQSVSRSGNFFNFIHHEWTGADCSITKSVIHADTLKKIASLQEKVSTLGKINV